MRRDNQAEIDMECIAEGAEFTIRVHYGEQDLYKILMNCVQKYNSKKLKWRVKIVKK